MIDDERLQELLSKASSLYNGGDYKEAISAWKEALSVDPASQKAQEGIRMATLLLGDLDTGAPEEAITLPADGADPAEAAIPPEEAEARIDLGVARVKQLLAERKYSEAMEGAQGLLPLDPQSPEILSLLEQAQHAFESAPFIEEHLVLSRELLAQERFSEAEAECKKVFTVDATHPGAKGLLKEIRDKIQSSLKAAASQLGGMTVKLSMPQALAAGAKFGVKTKAEPPTPPAPPAPAPAPRQPLPEGAEAQAEEPPVFETGEAALKQEEVSARAALEAAFDDPVLGGSMTDESPFELAGTGPGGIGSPDPTPAAPPPEEFVEAKTVRPPTSRVVPREPAPEAAPAASAAETKPAPSAPVAPPPVVSSHAKKADEAAAPAKTAGASVAAKSSPVRPAAAAPKAASPAKPDAKAAVPVAQVAEDATTAWETELTQLNLKDKERGLLRGTGAKATGKAPETSEMDLMSLLDSGGLPGMTPGENDAAAPQAESVPLAKAKESPKPAPRPSPAKGASRAEATESVSEAPATATRLRKAEKPRPAPSARRGGSSLLKLLLLLVLLAAAAGGGYYVYNQPGLLPRLLGGAGQPSHPVEPPAGAPAGAVEAGHGPIPTPIGNTSRQQTAPPQTGEGASAGASVAGPAPGGPPPAAPAGAPPPAGPPQGASAAGASPQGNPGGAASAPAAAARSAPSNEPIKPPTAPPLSKEETQRRIAVFTADGKRLIAAGKWREARAKLNAVLALDPANMEVKDLSDKAQAKIDEDQKLQDEFDSTKKLYADKDYENALRKLYRLPRDKGLGDIDLYIRNSWYNWAVALLKAGNTKDAQAKLSEELTVDPDDAAALKLQEVAEKYTNRAKDRTYYAFTDGLTLRPFEQK